MVWATPPERITAARLASSSGRAAPLFVLGGHFQVHAKFLFEVGVPPAGPKRSPQADDPFAQRLHLMPPSRHPSSLEERLDDGCHAIPLGFLGREPPPPARGHGIEARLPIVVGDAPRRAEEAALLEAHETRIEGAHVEPKRTP